MEQSQLSPSKVDESPQKGNDLNLVLDTDEPIIEKNSHSSDSKSSDRTGQCILMPQSPVNVNDDPEVEVSDYCVKRIKERSIREIMEKISSWRRLYNGVQVVKDPQTGALVKQRVKRMSLERASKYVGLSKKSLDDYLLQMRFGAKFGFDFDQHINDKMGVLRQFVKQKKQELKEQTGSQKISSKLSVMENQAASERLS
jgi:hypothetical protein